MAINEEDFLIQTIGRNRHFSVPEGYFEQFGAQMMEQLVPAKAEVRSIRGNGLWRNVIYAAACLAAVVVMAGSYIHKYEEEAGMKPYAAQVAKTMSGGDEIEQAADYMMLDESDLYAYMTDY